MPTYNAQVIPRGDIHNGHIHERCIAHHNQINTIGRNTCQQVLIKRDASDGVTFALYTIIDVHDEEPDVVFVGYKDTEFTHHDLQARLGLPSTDLFTGKVNSQVTDDSEFTEHLIDNGRERLSSKCVSLWGCKGFKQGGGAFNRWYITSRNISEGLFSKLKTVIGRRFEYEVALHDWSANFICIGGSIST